MTLIDAMFYVFCGTLLCIVLYWILLVIVVTSLEGFFADKDSVIRELENLGYSEIKILRHSWFLVALRGGGKNGTAKFTVSAKNPQGKRSVFVFCTGPAPK